MVAGLMCHNARQMQRIKVPRVSCQYLFVNGIGLRQLALLVQGECFLK